VYVLLDVRSYLDYSDVLVMLFLVAFLHDFSRPLEISKNKSPKPNMIISVCVKESPKKGPKRSTKQTPLLRRIL
jgi:hypothetical protein